MKTISLTIPNMKSAHCQMAVTNAVKLVGGTIKSVSPGRAQIELADNITHDVVVDAIRNAGYNVADESI